MTTQDVLNKLLAMKETKKFKEIGKQQRILMNIEHHALCQEYKETILEDDLC